LTLYKNKNIFCIDVLIDILEERTKGKQIARSRKRLHMMSDIMTKKHDMVKREAG